MQLLRRKKLPVPRAFGSCLLARTRLIIVCIGWRGAEGCTRTRPPDLVLALEYGWDHVVSKFLKRKGTPIDGNFSMDDEEGPAIVLAGKQAGVGVLKHFLQRHDLNVNVNTDAGLTPLHAVARRGLTQS